MLVLYYKIINNYLLSYINYLGCYGSQRRLKMTIVRIRNEDGQKVYAINVDGKTIELSYFQAMSIKNSAGDQAKLDSVIAEIIREHNFFANR